MFSSLSLSICTTGRKRRRWVSVSIHSYILFRRYLFVYRCPLVGGKPVPEQAWLHKLSPIFP